MTFPSSAFRRPAASGGAVQPRSDAQVFTRRWVIRDKDPTLKVLLRKLEKANSAVVIEEAMGTFKQELSSRALLPTETP